MKINHYVINLDRSTDRRAAIEADAERAGLRLIRVPAVDGKTVPVAERGLLDAAGFRRLHGKHPMDGEFGCYASHLRALDLFLESDAEAALILEDDVRFKPGFETALDAIAAVPDFDLVKLAHHRRPRIRTLRQAAGHRLGRAVFGPTGSSAAYLVTRAGATRLRAALDPMRLPYDVALERAWASGLRILHAVPDLVLFNAETSASLTMGGQTYASRKLPPWRRLTTLAFRTKDLVGRLAYAARADRT
ncbi:MULTISPECIES: glycosyltransferase family 25 protein [unclassified Aureimonas]|uniref:glycosyltransferase family 25 protein n=1 Tax=unclassified Aureimonas TaxID=2615206 RepID=UPI0006F8F9F7|nr:MULTISPECIES: glycosyltransferase family 25 protein [unclassified Aureimonas]KQT61287.1 hypothetical protein ASG54_24455 [Aureimonas sp. Leaf460]KQT68736.1 hypothetical protein ASG62_19215 [Aureimonas sp. Leaf427]